jgi:hypothetical protein
MADDDQHWPDFRRTFDQELTLAMPARINRR